MRPILTAVLLAALLAGCGHHGPGWPDWSDWADHFALSDISYSDTYLLGGVKGVRVSGVVTNLDSSTYYLWVMCRALDANGMEITANNQFISPLAGHSSARFSVDVPTYGRSVARWDNYVSCYGDYVPPPS